MKRIKMVFPRHNRSGSTNQWKTFGNEKEEGLRLTTQDRHDTC